VLQQVAHPEMEPQNHGFQYSNGLISSMIWGVADFDEPL
jgi:hypothetical protein